MWFLIVEPKSMLQLNPIEGGGEPVFVEAGDRDCRGTGARDILPWGLRRACLVSARLVEVFGLFKSFFHHFLRTNTAYV